MHFDIDTDGAVFKYIFFISFQFSAVFRKFRYLIRRNRCIDTFEPECGTFRQIKLIECREPVENFAGSIYNRVCGEGTPSLLPIDEGDIGGGFTMTVTEKLAALRSAMKNRNVDGVYVPSSDPHMTEYLPARWRSRAWLSGFTGSAGTLCVTGNQAALWTDGRYFIQAERQLAGSGITLMRMAQPGVPTVEQWLAENLPEGGTLAIDSLCTSAATVETMEQAFEKKHVAIQDHDFISELWTEDRPPVPATEAWLVDKAQAGLSAAEKVEALRERLSGQGAEAMLVCRLDSVAWLLNLRADDVAYNPFALSYCLVEPDHVSLFVDSSRIPEKVQEELTSQGVVLQPYDGIVSALKDLKGPMTVLYEPEGTSLALVRALSSNHSVTLMVGEELVRAMKAVKNETEMACQREAHRRDGAAMVRFEMELRRRMETGENWTELEASDYLLSLRMEQENCMGPSFETIAAYGANAAMMHYAPKPESCAAIKPRGFLLVDSGGQYRDGTTDITRTYALGPLTDEEKEAYTLVLKCHIAAAMAVFKEGSTGRTIDILARETLWRRGLDYRCGTGHGVGFVGVIHEGPQGLGPKYGTPFVPGMTVTDEPGIYEEGRLGVRIENELLCVPVCETEYGKFYGFETFTYCPIDTRPLKLDLLSDEELAWLNRYHEMVLRELGGCLNAEEAAWLKAACAPVTRG